MSIKSAERSGDHTGSVAIEIKARKPLNSAYIPKGTDSLCPVFILNTGLTGREGNVLLVSLQSTGKVVSA